MVENLEIDLDPNLEKAEEIRLGDFPVIEHFVDLLLHVSHYQHDLLDSGVAYRFLLTAKQQEHDLIENEDLLVVLFTRDQLQKLHQISLLPGINGIEIPSHFVIEDEVGQQPSGKIQRYLAWLAELQKPGVGVRQHANNLQRPAARSPGCSQNHEELQLVENLQQVYLLGSRQEPDQLQDLGNFVLHTLYPPLTWFL